MFSSGIWGLVLKENRHDIPWSIKVSIFVELYVQFWSGVFTDVGLSKIKIKII